jgi:predicted GNAT family N-acyltransferase
MSHAFIVRAADWKHDEAAIAEVRRQVFIAEQGVPEALEWEEQDAQCHWFIAVASARKVIGIVRLTDAARIGRMAVMPGWRRRGVGRALLDAVLHAALALGFGQAQLSAQTHAIGFYARRGFIAQGPEYLDAGIPHRTMTLSLKDSI